jgi:hypothetical protein
LALETMLFFLKGSNAHGKSKIKLANTTSSVDS